MCWTNIAQETPTQRQLGPGWIQAHATWRRDVPVGNYGSDGEPFPGRDGETMGEGSFLFSLGQPSLLQQDRQRSAEVE